MEFTYSKDKSTKCLTSGGLGLGLLIFGLGLGLSLVSSCLGLGLVTLLKTKAKVLFLVLRIWSRLHDCHTLHMGGRLPGICLMVTILRHSSLDRGICSIEFRSGIHH